MTVRELLNQKLGLTGFILKREEIGALRIIYQGDEYRISNALCVEKALDHCLVTDGDSRRLEKLLRGEQWDGNGLPPVGTVCQWDNGENDWCDVKVMGVDGDEVWVKPLDGSQSFVVFDGDFKPLVDEKKVAIDAMLKTFNSLKGDITNADICEALYNAGWRKHDDI